MGSLLRQHDAQFAANALPQWTLATGDGKRNASAGEKRLGEVDMRRFFRTTILLVATLFAAPPAAFADTPESLAKATFARIPYPCADNETWITPDRIVLTKDGGAMNEYDKGELVVKTPQPPKGFDPTVAADSALAEYGFPERPSEPEELASWAEDMSAWRPTRDLGECETDAKATIIDGQRWSGYSADQASSTYYRAVQGDFHQPAKLTTACSPSQVVTWVGLGGHHTNKLIQDGTGIAADGSKYAWYEYVSDFSFIPLTKLPAVSVHTGDAIHLYVVHQTSGAGQTTFYVADNTSGTSQTKIVDLGSTYYDGTTAEFIDERPAVWNGSAYVPTNLTNFDEVNWTNAKVYKYDGTWHSLGSEPNNAFNMWNAGYVHYLAWPSTMSSNTTFKDNWIACS